MIDPTVPLAKDQLVYFVPLVAAQESIPVRFVRKVGHRTTDVLVRWLDQQTTRRVARAELFLHPNVFVVRSDDVLWAGPTLDQARAFLQTRDQSFVVITRCAPTPVEAWTIQSGQAERRQVVDRTISGIQIWRDA